MLEIGREERRALAARGLFVPVPWDRKGRMGPTRQGTRNGSWRRSSHGLWVPSGVERSPEQRILEAAMVLPGHGGVTGWAALRWMRAAWFDGLGPNGIERPVWLVTAGDHIRPQPGIAVSAERLALSDLMTFGGLRLTLAVRSVWFEMRYARDARAAAVVLSMAAYSDLVSVDELADYAYEHPAWTGAPQCRAGAAMAYENCWSPMEVETANVWHVDAELPHLRCNRPLFDLSGRHLGTPDLFDPVAGLVIEYEGEIHLDKARRASDVRREELFRRHGLNYMAVVGADLADKWSLVERMQSTRRRSPFTPCADRAWTDELPASWTPTHTVALRRQLSDDQRARLLGYRLSA